MKLKFIALCAASFLQATHSLPIPNEYHSSPVQQNNKGINNHGVHENQNGTLAIIQNYHNMMMGSGLHHARALQNVTAENKAPPSLSRPSHPAPTKSHAAGSKPPAPTKSHAASSKPQHTSQKSRTISSGSKPPRAQRQLAVPKRIQ